MNPRTTWTVDRVASVALMVLTVAGYLATLTWGSYPGMSTGLVAQEAGAVPRVSPSSPLWSCIVWAVAYAGHAQTIPLRLNALSALFGALAVALLYRLMVSFITLSAPAEREHAGRVAVASRLAGIGSSLFLAFCVPFWMASNRALPATFDTLLLLVLVRMLLGFLQTQSIRLLCVLAFCYGLAMAEFATLALFAPLFVLAVAFDLLRNEALTTRNVVRPLLFLLAGMTIYFVVAWAFYGSEGYVIREYTSYWQVLWHIWRDQVWSLTRSLPRVGWLIVLVITVVPAATVLSIARRALGGERDWAFSILHVVLSGVAVAVALNLRISPWSMNMGPVIQVTPYVLQAFVVGYLLAYWFLLPATWWEHSEERLHKVLRPALGTLFALPGVGLLFVVPFLNLPHADGRQSRFVDEYARQTLASVGTRTWVVTDGAIDDQLLVAARCAGRPIHILNPYSLQQNVATKRAIQGLPSARLRNVAQSSMMNLLLEWMPQDDAIEQKMAILSVPDFWVAAGRKVVPDKTVFLGQRDTASLSSKKLIEDHRAFWAHMLDLKSACVPRDPQVVALQNHAVRQIGMVANNLGVLLQDMGSTNEAFEAYDWAMRIDTNNLSALLNASAMVTAGFPCASADAIRSRLEQVKNSSKGVGPLWALARVYGYVRSPEAFAQTGLTWALSGRPGIAVSGLQTALQLAQGAERDRVRLALAELQFVQDQKTEGEAIYQDVLANDPKNLGALLGLSRVRATEGKVDEASAFLRRAEEAGAERSVTAPEWARLYLGMGQPERARIVLQELIEFEPKLLLPRAMLAEILLRQNDQEALGVLLNGLTSVPQSEGLDAYVRGQLALREKDLDGARRYLERALVAWPRNTRVLTQILQLNLLQGRPQQQREYARRLLQIDPANAMANYCMGSMQLGDKEYDLAEDSLRRSIEARKTPEALNDLAWLLQNRGENAEAEKLAREALALNDKIYALWDTLGLILVKTQRLPEAEAAFEKAISLYPDDLAVILNMAELQITKGDRQKATPLLRRLQEQRQLLSADDQKRLDRVLQP